MLRVDHYLYLPGCCGFCRSVNLPTIDTGIDLDHPNSPDDDNPSANRRFYVCADCCIELARMVVDSRSLELITSGSNQALSGMITELSESNIKLSGRIDELETALRIMNTIPKAPVDEAPPAKKNFKVVSPKDVEL